MATSTLEPDQDTPQRLKESHPESLNKSLSPSDEAAFNDLANRAGEGDSPGLHKREEDLLEAVRKKNEPKELSKKEGEEAEQEPAAEEDEKQGIFAKLRGGKRKAIIGLTAFSTLAMITGFGLFGGKAFELVVFAKVLDAAYNSLTVETSDGRMNQIYRFLRDPRNPENRRLGALAKKFTANIEADFKSAGFEFDYSGSNASSTGFLERIYVDDGSVGNLINDPDIGDDFQRRLNIDNNPNSPRFGRGYIDIGDTPTSNKLQRQMIRRVTNQTKLKSVPGVIASRAIIRKAAVKLKPFGNFKNKTVRSARIAIDTRRTQLREIRAKYIELGKTPFIKLLNGGANDAERSNGDFDANEKARAVADADALSKTTGSSAKAKLAKISSTIKAGSGKILGVIILSCAVYELADNYPAIQHARVVQPLIRSFQEFRSAGSQLLYGGGGISSDEVEFLSDFLFDHISEVSTSVYDAAAIQYETGQPVIGYDIPAVAKVTPDTNQVKAVFQKIPGLSSACEAANSKAGQIISTGAGFLFSPLQEFAAQGVSRLFGDDIVNFIFGIVLNAEVDPTPYGQLAGAYAGHGGRHSSNQVAITAGGVPMSEESERVLRNDRLDRQRLEDSRKGFGHRFFALDNPRSFAFSMYRQLPRSFAGIKNTLAGAMSNFGIGSLIDTFSGSVFAQSVKEYDYGFPLYGFTQEELNDERFDNPFQNLAQLENKALGITIQDYHNEYASDCFDLVINESTVDNSGGSISIGQGKSYNELGAQKCRDGGGEFIGPQDNIKVSPEDFLRYRFYILDMMTMTAMACYQGDSVACTELGYETINGDSDINTDLPSGSPQTLAQALLDSDNVSAYENPTVDLERIASGEDTSRIFPDLLRVLVRLSETHEFTITSLRYNRSGTTSRHVAGLAADISGASGIDGVRYGYDTPSPVIFKFIQDAGELLPSNGENVPGPKKCELGVPYRESNPLFTEIADQYRKCKVFYDKGDGPHIHLALPRP